MELMIDTPMFGLPSAGRAMRSKPGATYQDVLDAPSHLVAEILGGDLYLSPRPAPPHAAAAGALYYELAGPFRFGRGGPGGWVLLEEPELHLEGHGRPIVPDLAGWRRARMPVVPETPAIDLVPDWVCEVLSPGTEAVDRTLKMPIYARAGVSNLWLMDPVHRIVECHERALEGFQVGWRHVCTWTGDAALHLAPFAEVAIDFARLWSR
jgi:hypothetical protein